MKKKYVWGSVITGVTFCAVMAFNSFVFPKVLAATPTASAANTVSAASVAASSTVSTPSTLSDDQLHQYLASLPKDKADAAERDMHPESTDVNAISKDKAMEIAKRMVKDKFSGSNLTGTAFYTYNNVPGNPSSWTVYVTQNALTSDLQQAYLVYLNAYTGKSIGQDGIFSCYIKTNTSEGSDGIFVTTSLSQSSAQ
ncbi:MAG: hypothetical protein GX424_04575 [Clostridiales bacterium]|nr:hypothetical protein [Clostridiales bacterium]